MSTGIDLSALHVASVINMQNDKLNIYVKK